MVLEPGVGFVRIVLSFAYGLLSKIPLRAHCFPVGVSCTVVTAMFFASCTISSLPSTAPCPLPHMLTCISAAVRQ